MKSLLSLKSKIGVRKSKNNKIKLRQQNAIFYKLIQISYLYDEVARNILQLKDMLIVDIS